MRNKLKEKDLIIVFYSLIILILVILFISVFKGEKTGRAWTIEDNKFEEDFNSLDSPWEGNGKWNPAERCGSPEGYYRIH